MQSQSKSPHINGSAPQLYRAQSLDAFLASEISLAETDENALSEEQLRELYDNEEIDRFLGIFSDFVTEVQASDTPSPTAQNSAEKNVCFGNQSDTTHPTSEDGEWTPLRDEDGNILPKTTPASLSTCHSLSEEIAYRYLVPILPLPRPTPTFTLGHLRLATQRMYLAVLPIYGPFFSRLKDLATWEDQRTSLMHCCIFWTLWWYSYLGAALVLRILYSLIRRRFLPYPSLDDLRQHREEILCADEFGEQVSARLSPKGSGMIEIWRLIRFLDGKKKKAKKGVKQTKAKVNNNSEEELDDISVASQEQDETVLDSVDDSQDAQDTKQIALQILEEIADVHERVHNVFIWRKPYVSRIYGGVLFALFLLTLCPIKYIVKLATFVLGFAFWHVIPVIAALQPSERKRLPPLFCNVPNDAEFAMQLISQRIASGLEIQPKRTKIRRKKDSESIKSFKAGGKHDQSSQSLSQSSDRSIDWKKWGDRVALGKSAVNDMKRLKPGNPWPMHDVWPPQHPMIPDIVGMAQPRLTVETHTYPCQHTSAPGLITLAQNALFFTPLMSQNAKMSIPLTAVKGIKKAGLLKGLSIRWNDTVEGNEEQKEDKFLWVGGRDELFARLVGSDSTAQWMKV